MKSNVREPLQNNTATSRSAETAQNRKNGTVHVPYIKPTKRSEVSSCGPTDMTNTHVPVHVYQFKI